MVPVRPLNLETDIEAVRRMWHESGWLLKDQSGGKALEVFFRSADAWVDAVSETPECVVSTMPGRIRYLSEDIPFVAVTSVNTGIVGRRQGLARGVLGHALTEAATGGAAVAILGAFEQGFYDALGFGTGTYQRTIRFDPSDLSVPKLGARPRRMRRPQRFSSDDAEGLHEARLRRMRRHGGCNILPSGITVHETLYFKNAFGIGYRDRKDSIPSHYLWCVFHGESGPLEIQWMVFRTIEELKELFLLIQVLGDQYHTVELREPVWLQFQVSLNRPFRRIDQTADSKSAHGALALAYWQARILDVEKAIPFLRLPSEEPIAFHLALTDPLSAYNSSNTSWSGVAGDYVIRLGRNSEARRGVASDLPTLRADVNSLTRLWLGVATAEALSVTDGMEGDEDLIHRLSRGLRLPLPGLDWEFSLESPVRHLWR